MCEIADRELPYHYICALCGQGNTEEVSQGVSICPPCLEKMDEMIKRTTWEK